MRRFQLSLRSAAICVALLCGLLAIVVAWENRCKNPDAVTEEKLASLINRQGGQVYWDALPKGPITWLSGRPANRKICIISLIESNGWRRDTRGEAALFAEIAELKHVRAFSILGGSGQPDELHLTKLPSSLHKVTVMKFRIDDTTLQKMENLQKLIEIWIAHCDLDISPAQVRKLPQSLERLYIDTAPALWIEALSGHEKLRYVDLASCKGVTDDLIPLVIGSHIRKIGARPKQFTAEGREKLKAAGVFIAVSGSSLDD